MRQFGGIPVTYGDGLVDRLTELAPEGYAAALDAVGTDEAVDVSLELVADRSRIVTIAAFGRADAAGIQAIAGATPDSAAYRDRIRGHLVELAGQGLLTVPVAQRFPFEQAKDALELLKSGHAGGKLALIVGQSEAASH